MKTLRWIHTADWHPRSLGTVGGKLVIDSHTGLSITLTDFQNSLDFLFDTITEQRIPLLLVAGDVFDSNKPTMDELRVVMSFFERCSDAGVLVVVIPGNHDLAQSSFLSTALEPVTFLGIQVIQSPYSVLLDVEGKKVRIDCLPYPSRGRLIAQMQDRKTCTPEELTAYINRGLFNILQAFQMKEIESDHRILLAHGSVEQAMVGEQPRTLAHDVFIPTKDIENFYDYVALGHIHKTQGIGDRGMYCGSLMRNGFGEEKELKGFLIGEFTTGGVITTHVENPFARVYKTLKVHELEPLPENHDVVYRIQDTIQEERVPVAMPAIQRFVKALPFVQVDVDVEKADRVRDSELNNQMDSTQALERCLERDGIIWPELSLCRQLHLELCEEGTK